jgi:hypothetical protein
MFTAAAAYTAVVSLAIVYIWAMDIAYLNSDREHLLPSMILLVLGLPTSLTMDWLYSSWPDSFTGLLQTAYLTACGIFQAGVLWMFSLKRDVRNDL